MEEPVLIIVGEWECLDTGSWHFCVSRNIYAKCVGLSQEDNFLSFKTKVNNAFGRQDNMEIPSLSFWIGSSETVFTQTKMPPISVDSDESLDMFRRTRLEDGGRNLFMSNKKDYNEGGDKVTEETCGDKNENSYEETTEGDRAYEDEEFLLQVSRLESRYKSSNNSAEKIDDGRNENLLESTGQTSKRQKIWGTLAIREETTEGPNDISFGDNISHEGSPSYDFNFMTDLLEWEYPTQWDPLEGEPPLTYKNVDGGHVISGHDDGGHVIGGHVELIRTLESAALHTNVLSTDGQRGVIHETGEGHVPRVYGQELVPVTGNITEVGESSVKRRLQFDEEDEPLIEGPDIVNTNDDQQTNFEQEHVESLAVNPLCGQQICIYGEHDGSDDGGGPSVETTLTSTDNPLFIVDPEPFLDNVKVIRSDKANMNLKKGDDALYVGLVFKNKAELHNAISVYSLKRLFSFKVRSSDKQRVIVVCQDNKCDWRIYATKHKDSENIEIRTATLKHTCDVESRSKYSKKATAELLGELLKTKYAHGMKGPRACEVPKLVLSEMNVTISYMKAWKTKEIAMRKARGNDEDNYQFLSTYLHLLKTTNPGTITATKTVKSASGNTLFKYLFFALGASIAGFKYLRKVIVIDGTHTKGKYQSCLVAASGQDGNYQIFPLAFGVIDGENTAGWTWFFQQLSQFVTDSEDIVFVSDRHQSIYASLRSVYPLAKHGACVIHLCRNVKHRFKCDGLATMVSNAARAYTVGDFRYWFEEIQNRNKKCAQYLVDIGIPHWTLAYFTGMRYNLMSSNISESLNAVLQQALELPIATMVESIRTMLMNWFCTRREKSRKTSTRCTPQVENMLIKQLRHATDCAVIAASDWIYQVNDSNGCVFTVDLENKTCTCRVFDVLMVPCCHALACVGIKNIDIYSLVGECYSVKTWEKLWTEKILPPGKEQDIDVPEQEVHVYPPKTRRGSGRPRTTRIPSRGEHPWVNRKCTRCKKHGHNRASCKNPI